MITKLFLRIIESSSLSKSQQPKVVEKPIFRIGRDLDNDWVIDCPNRLISRHHCVIERINNTFTISDLSKNGVFINNSPAPIGLGNSGVLNDGDILILPGIKISVTFSADQSSQTADPFLALLPARENGSSKNNTPQDQDPSSPTANIDRNTTISGSYDFLKDRSSLPIIDQSIDTVGNHRPWQPSSKPNLDRLSAERDSFRAALPKTLAIPEDWDKEDETPRQSLSSVRARSEITTNPKPDSLPSKPVDLQKQLLLKLLSEFFEIERSFSNSGKSELASILNEQSLNWLRPKDLDLAFQCISKITQSCIASAESGKLLGVVIPSGPKIESSHDIIDDIIQKSSEDSEVENTLDFPLTGANINELE